MRSGRKVKEAVQPMKWVKQRAATVNRQRELELALEIHRGVGGNDEGVMQGLYACSQTELYRPDPVIDVSLPTSFWRRSDCRIGESSEK